MKKVVLTWSAFIFGLLGLVLGIASYYSSNSESDMRKSLMSQEYLDNALKYLDIKPVEPGTLAWNRKRGDILSVEDIKTLEDARREIEKLEVVSPDSEELFFLKLTYLSQSGNIRTVEKFLDENSDFIGEHEKLVYIGMLYANNISGKRQAIDYFEEALKLDPTNTDTRGMYALILHSLNENEDSIRQFYAALSIDSTNIKLKNKLAHVLAESDAIDEAEQLLVEAIELGQDDAETYNVLGAIYNHNLDHERAIQAFSKAINMDPSVGIFHYNISLLYRHIGNNYKSDEHKAIAEKLGMKFDPRADYRSVIH